MFTPADDSITFIAGPFDWHIPRWPVHYSWVYLYHFSEKLHHAAHYLGSTCNLDGRLLLHRRGHGTRLTQVVVESGRDLELVRLWPCDSWEESRDLEKHLKHQHNSPRLCPICNPRLGPDPLVGLRLGHWPLRIHAYVGRRRPMNERNCINGIYL